MCGGNCYLLNLSLGSFIVGLKNQVSHVNVDVNQLAPSFITFVLRLLVVLDYTGSLLSVNGERYKRAFFKGHLHFAEIAEAILK